MMKLAMMLMMVFVITVNCLQGPYDDHVYQSQSSKAKLDQLAAAIAKDSTPEDWPGAFTQSQLFLEGMDLSFDFKGDDFPKQGLFNLDTRKKLVHSVGSVVQVQWISLNNSYTGVFAGCKNALLRFSVAKPVNTKPGELDSMTPGIAIKCLRNYVPSGNIFAMYSLIGQTSYNFFAHDLTNHVPELPIDGPLALQLLRKKFSGASDYPAFIGLSEFAKYDEFGFSSPTLSFPFRLQFHPNRTLHYASPDTYSGDYTNQIKRLISPGQHLYDIYAQDTPLSEQLNFIGKIVATSYLTTSSFGDKSLFFQHTRFEDDLKLRPSWEKPAKQLLEKQRQFKGAGYTYPDLPWR